MAIFELTVGYIDFYKRRGTKRFQLEAIDFPTALTNAGVFVTALEGAMGANIESYKVAQETANSDSATAASNKDAGITISCDLGGGKRAALKIPTPEDAYLNPDGTVDLTNALITAVEADYLSGKVLISDGETVLDFLSGKLDK